ncbi:hypothetical protein CRENPOLYSF2_3070015 [Crenothrix polyspora]|uniref:Uncharacterized protein n=1 Tax=Crenothrix polyspora TaxID=360316 RepID=A0A1R4HAN9_9GAMM|nr:hypothetical protein CRENPOLYSF2_3070015 [Crenothrix polyspora]
MPNCYKVYRAIHQALIKALGFEVKGNQARHLNADIPHPLFQICI